MEYLIGWGLLLGIGTLLWLVVRFAGGERGEPEATCGLDGCGSPKGTRVSGSRRVAAGVLAPGPDAVDGDTSR